MPLFVTVFTYPYWGDCPGGSPFSEVEIVRVGKVGAEIVRDNLADSVQVRATLCVGKGMAQVTNQGDADGFRFRDPRKDPNSPKKGVWAFGGTGKKELKEALAASARKRAGFGTAAEIVDDACQSTNGNWRQLAKAYKEMKPKAEARRKFIKRLCEENNIPFGMSLDIPRRKPGTGSGSSGGGNAPDSTSSGTSATEGPHGRDGLTWGPLFPGGPEVPYDTLLRLNWDEKPSWDARHANSRWLRNFRLGSVAMLALWIIASYFLWWRPQDTLALVMLLTTGQKGFANFIYWNPIPMYTWFVLLALIMTVAWSWLTWFEGREEIAKRPSFVIYDSLLDGTGVGRIRMFGSPLSVATREDQISSPESSQEEESSGSPS